MGELCDNVHRACGGISSKWIACTCVTASRSCHDTAIYQRWPDTGGWLTSIHKH